MRQNSISLAAAASLAVLLAVANSAVAQFGSHPEEQKIDVSSYPTEVQHGYKVFANKCSECHDLASSVKQSRSLEGWTGEVHRMRAMASSHINSRETDKIVKFLGYDETHRKAAAHEAMNENSRGSAGLVGGQIFESYGCSSCHSVAGAGNTSSALDGVASKRTPAEIKKFIVAPPSSCIMPPVSVPEKDLNNLVAYLLTLK